VEWSGGWKSAAACVRVWVQPIGSQIDQSVRLVECAPEVVTPALPMGLESPTRLDCDSTSLGLRRPTPIAGRGGRGISSSLHGAGPGGRRRAVTAAEG